MVERRRDELDGRQDAEGEEGSFFATGLDPSFPSRLRALPRPPDWIEVQGPLGHRLDHLTPCVAVVGTRQPSLAAVEFTHALAASLAEAGVVVISGGAAGIDAAAHAGALSVAGSTVVVLPGAIDAWSPAQNAPIFRRARRQGALVSIRRRGERPDFFQRNAVIAALADHVVVVAAPVKSGARNTAAAARTLGRPLWVVPGAPWDGQMAGCALELLSGAKALVRVDELLGALGRPILCRRRKHVSSAAPAASSDDRAPGVLDPRIRELLRQGPRSVDDLVLRTGLPPGPLRAHLLTCTVEGVLREGPAGLFRLVTS